MACESPRATSPSRSNSNTHSQQLAPPLPPPLPLIPFQQERRTTRKDDDGVRHVVPIHHHHWERGPRLRVTHRDSASLSSRVALFSTAGKFFSLFTFCFTDIHIPSVLTQVLRAAAPPPPHTLALHFKRRYVFFFFFFSLDSC